MYKESVKKNFRYIMSKCVCGFGSNFNIKLYAFANQSRREYEWRYNR